MSQPSFEEDLEAVDFDAPSDAFETAEEATPAPAAAPAARYRKQGFSVYTLMLIISFISLLIAMILLLVEASKYT